MEKVWNYQQNDVYNDLVPQTIKVNYEHQAVRLLKLSEIKINDVLLYYSLITECSKYLDQHTFH